jgi:hypothetical protein
MTRKTKCPPADTTINRFAEATIVKENKKKQETTKGK